MAFPTLYVDTGGHAQGSGSTDTASPTVSAASGASVSGTTVTLAASPDLSGVAADGSQTIFINDATNSNRKLFKITAVDNTAKTVTVDTAPSGTITNSAWGIGGRFVYDSARFEAAMAPGWTLVFNNSPASKSSAFLTRRTAGNTTDGKIIVKGKTGVRPQLIVTNTANVITGSVAVWHFENLEFIQQGASGDVVTAAVSQTFIDCKISDGGGVGFLVDNGSKVVACEVLGCGGDGISMNNNCSAMGNYVHDSSGSGIRSFGSNGADILFNVVDTCASRGIHIAQTPTNNDGSMSVIGNTVYGCGDSGFQVDDTDTSVMLYNNILSENGDAAGEFNVEWVAGSDAINSIHGYNLFHHTGGGGGANLSGLTANSTELTSDPAFVSAGSGNFTLSGASPAIGAGFPGAFLGGTFTGFMDIGAVQIQFESGGGGDGLTASIFGGLITDMQIGSGPWFIDDTLTFSVVTHDPLSSAAIDADSVPSYRVYEDETGTAILTGSMAKLDDTNTLGFYSEQITLSAANGFEAGKSYNVLVTAVVDGDSGQTSAGFKVVGNLPAAVNSMAADTLTASALASDAVTEIQSGLATAAAVATIDDFLDTEIAAIKASTDNLPADPADASDIAALIAGLDTKLDTIDNLIDTEIASIISAIAALNNISVADVNAQVLDVVNVDTFTEPTGVPPATNTIRQMIHTLYMIACNGQTVTNSKLTYLDSGGAAEFEKDLTDDGTTYSENRVNSI